MSSTFGSATLFTTGAASSSGVLSVPTGPGIASSTPVSSSVPSTSGDISGGSASALSALVAAYADLLNDLGVALGGLQIGLVLAGMYVSPVSLRIRRSY